MLTRRGMLRGLGAALAVCWVPSPFGLSRLLAQTTGGDLNFLFVFNYGGWDPTTVYAPMFGYETIDMEATATEATVGSLTFVDSAARPSVRSFFEAWHARTVFLNGINVPSLAHDVCLRIAMTGASSGDGPDWATRLANAERDRFTLPHLVLTGPVFPGSLGAAVSRVGANGQLDTLLSGSILESSDVATGRPDALQERIMDRYLARRAAARADGAMAGSDATLTAAFAESLDRARSLKDRQYDMKFIPGASLTSQAKPAVDALSLGISRCVSIASGGNWDTHVDNTDQSGQFEALFAGLSELMELLTATAGPDGKPLVDRTVVVVLSEMGRTPQLNAGGGKDHWPYTSAMLVGPGLTGDRVVGAFDELYYGIGVDPVTAELDAGAAPMTYEVLGATLLALADIDPGQAFPGVAPLTGILL